MGRAHSLLAAHRLQCPQPGTDQDEAGGRAGGEVHDPAGACPGEVVIPGARWQGRLSLGPYLEFIARVTSHIPDKGRDGALLWAVRQRPHLSII